MYGSHSYNAVTIFVVSGVASVLILAWVISFFFILIEQLPNSQLRYFSICSI